MGLFTTLSEKKHMKHHRQQTRQKEKELHAAQTTAETLSQAEDQLARDAELLTVKHQRSLLVANSADKHVVEAHTRATTLAYVLESTEIQQATVAAKADEARSKVAELQEEIEKTEADHEGHFDHHGFERTHRLLGLGKKEKPAHRRKSDIGPRPVPPQPLADRPSVGAVGRGQASGQLPPYTTITSAGKDRYPPPDVVTTPRTVPQQTTTQGHDLLPLLPFQTSGTPSPLDLPLGMHDLNHRYQTHVHDRPYPSL